MVKPLIDGYYVTMCGKVFSNHSTRVLRKNIGSNNRASKLTEEQVLKIKCHLEDGKSLSYIASQFAVTIHAIFRIRHGYNWSWLTGYEKKGNTISCDL